MTGKKSSVLELKTKIIFSGRLQTTQTKEIMIAVASQLMLSSFIHKVHYEQLAIL